MVKVDIDVRGIIKVNGDKDRACEVAQGIAFGFYNEDGEIEELPEDTEVINYKDNRFVLLSDEKIVV